MRALQFNQMHNIEMSVEQINCLLETNYVAVEKAWASEDEFANSDEVKELYHGWQANYRPVSKWGMEFLFGFMVKGNLFHTYVAEGLCITKHVTVSSSLHNGGVNEISFIKCDGRLAYSVNKGRYFDPSLLRKHNVGFPVVDGYDAAYL